MDNWCKIHLGISSESLKEIEDKSVHLIVTSPCYPMIEMWDEIFAEHNAKTYDEMHNQLTKTWRESYRVLVDGGIICINIGDATRTINGKFQVFPNHSRVIEECCKMGFTMLPYILWKKPINRPNAFLGSGFMPPNAYVTLDCEYILIFRKGGLRKFLPKDPNRIDSSFTKEERDKWFSQIWQVTGAKQVIDGYDERRTGAFPVEIPLRLIRMFSLKGETVLDPFLGTGTTALASFMTQRNSIGYEITKNLKNVIESKLALYKDKLTIISERN